LQPTTLLLFVSGDSGGGPDPPLVLAFAAVLDFGGRFGALAPRAAAYRDLSPGVYDIYIYIYVYTHTHIYIYIYIYIYIHIYK